MNETRTERALFYAIGLSPSLSLFFACVIPGLGVIFFVASPLLFIAWIIAFTQTVIAERRLIAHGDPERARSLRRMTRLGLLITAFDLVGVAIVFAIGSMADSFHVHTH